MPDRTKETLEEEGRREQEEESEELVAGPGVVGTTSMWTGAGFGALVGALMGGLLALAIAFFALQEGFRMVVITTVSGAIGGAVGGFVAGGYILPRRRRKVEEEADV